MPVNCGHVYCLYWPPAAKDKLLVPAYVLPDDRVRFFIINSELTPFQKARPELLKHAIPILQGLNSAFLTHDSWLCCHEVVAGFTRQQIDSAIGAYRGPLDGATQVRVKAIVEESRLHSDREKGLFLAQWPH